MGFWKRRRTEGGSSEESEELRLSLGDHLEELRVRIVRSLLWLVAGWVVGWQIQPWLYQELNRMIVANVTGPGVDYKEVFRNATEPFMLKFRLSFLIGLILAFPFIVLQLWGFVEPGLRPHESRPIKRLAPVSVLLFAMGVFFCWIILPRAFRWFVGYLAEFPGTSLYQEPGTLVFFVLKMLLAFGFGFQLPLVVFLLGKVGLLEPATLMRYWRQAAVAIFTMSAIVTPSNDAFSMLMMAVPLTALFAVSVWAIRLTTRNRRSEPEEAEPAEQSP
ncbi:MAG: twin-arginine translocase subunit TatC [Fimbriimonadales bacterium]|nr:twin-arginine translocase subunit TatC [Fimbriimonadales bacterium]